MVQRHESISGRPDEIAECWDGVLAVEGLYEALWAFVGSYTEPSPEESEEPIYGGSDDISNFWDKLSEEHQVALNELVTKQFWYSQADGEEDTSHLVVMAIAIRITQGKEKVNMARKYYTLLTRDHVTAPWGPQFGDYTRSIVKQERDDLVYNGEAFCTNTKIIETDEDQASIDAAVAELNKEMVSKV